MIDRMDAMPAMAGDRMGGMSGYYRTKFPVFYALEMRDWPAAAALQPVPGALPEDATMTWWARAIADGHLRHAEQAQADLAQYDALMAEVRKGRHAYYADSTGAQIGRNEIAAWASFAAGQQDEALKHMRDAADLQDKVGQGEVDIPAREMLADMLLELHHPRHALAEYRAALKLSPNRFNGLYNAGVAAEEAGDKTAAADYFAALLKTTGNGAQSSRPSWRTPRAFSPLTGLRQTTLASSSAARPRQAQSAGAGVCPSLSPAPSGITGITQNSPHSLPGDLPAHRRQIPSPLPASDRPHRSLPLPSLFCRRAVYRHRPVSPNCRRRVLPARQNLPAALSRLAARSFRGSGLFPYLLLNFSWNISA